VLCSVCLTNRFLVFSEHALTGQMVKVHIGGLEQGVPLFSMMFGYVYCSDRPAGVHMTQFCPVSMFA